MKRVNLISSLRKHILSWIIPWVFWKCFLQIIWDIVRYETSSNVVVPTKWHIKCDQIAAGAKSCASSITRRLSISHRALTDYRLSRLCSIQLRKSIFNRQIPIEPFNLSFQRGEADNRAEDGPRFVSYLPWANFQPFAQEASFWRKINSCLESGLKRRPGHPDSGILLEGTA